MNPYDLTPEERLLWRFGYKEEHWAPIMESCSRVMMSLATFVAGMQTMTAYMDGFTQSCERLATAVWEVNARFNARRNQRIFVLAMIILFLLVYATSRTN